MVTDEMSELIPMKRTEPLLPPKAINLRPLLFIYPDITLTNKKGRRKGKSLIIS